MRTPKYWVFSCFKENPKPRFVKAFSMFHYADQIIQRNTDNYYEKFLYNVDTRTLKRASTEEEFYDVSVEEIERRIIYWMSY